MTQHGGIRLGKGVKGLVQRFLKYGLYGEMIIFRDAQEVLRRRRVDAQRFLRDRVDKVESESVERLPVDQRGSFAV